MLEIITKHPIATGAIILGGGVILYLYWRGGSAPSTAVIQTGVDPQTAAIAAQAQQANQNFQLQLKGLDAQSQAVLAKIASEEAIAESGYSTAEAIARLQTDAAIRIQAGTDMAAANIAAINAGAITTSSMYKAQVDMAGIEAGLAGLRDTNATHLAETLDTNSTVLAGLKDTNRTNLAGLKDTNKTNYAIRESDNDTAIVLAGIGATKDITINQQNVTGAIEVNRENNVTTRFGIETQGKVYSEYIDAGKVVALEKVDADKEIGLAAIGSQAKAREDISSLMRSDPQFFTDPNRAAVATAALGYPGTASTIAVSGNQAAAVDDAANGPGAILQGVGNIIGNVANAAKNLITPNPRTVGRA